MYRYQRNYENLQKGIFKGAGDFDIPILSLVSCHVEQFVGFNYAMHFPHPQEAGIHFFVDDYQFERIWKSPDKYLSLLQKFSCVCTPDFSLYANFPEIIQIYNHYRKHWLGAYWQHNGIRVIPTITWSDERSYAWCFDGEPVGGSVAVSSVGTQNSMQAKALFLAGYNQMLHRLQPEQIFFYGQIPSKCRGNIVPIRAHYEEIHDREKAGRLKEKTK